MQTIILKLTILINLFRVQSAELWPGLPSWFMLLFARVVLLVMPARVIKKCEQLSSDEKVMFICNHQLWGIELPILLATIYLQTGRWPRSLADRGRINN